MPSAVNCFEAPCWRCISTYWKFTSLLTSGYSLHIWPLHWLWALVYISLSLPVNPACMDLSIDLAHQSLPGGKYRKIRSLVSPNWNSFQIYGSKQMMATFWVSVSSPINRGCWTKGTQTPFNSMSLLCFNMICKLKSWHLAQNQEAENWYVELFHLSKHYAHKV